MSDFILGSTSPRRRELLAAAGFDFKVIAPPPEAEPMPQDGDGPRRAVLASARAKAEAVVPLAPDRIVLAADTVVVLGERILGKPVDGAEAKAMLEALSGRVHVVLTAFVIRRPDRPAHEEVATTEVLFRRLTAGEIEAYVATGSCLDKAGAYGIQDLGGGLIKSINGSYTNVVGLPLAEVVEALALIGVVNDRTKSGAA